MNDLSIPRGERAVRPDFVPQEDNISPEVARLEKTALWTRTWQMACREEEIPQVGNFVTYEVIGQSIIVVRTEGGTIKAFHNVCQHRGQQLTAGCGTVNKFHCRFHGWQWSLDGELLRIQDREDYDGCEQMQDSDLGLSEVRVGLWGGFVYINMDPDCEPFEQYMAPVMRALGPMKFEDMRFAWYKTMVIKANWKTALESFMESYHVASIHPQYLPMVDERNKSFAEGLHGKHVYILERPMGAPSFRTGKPVPEDLREGIANVLAVFKEWVGDAEGKGQVTVRSADAAQRVLTELPAGLSPMDVTMAAIGFMMEAAAKEGVQWPILSMEQAMDAGVDWNIFPNMVLVFAFDGCLVFRARPNGDDHESCIFDMWSILRMAPHEVPPLEREFYADWKDHVDKIPKLLVQDLRNMESIQRGLHSLGLKGLRTNPVQEVQISHFHEVLHQYLYAN
ncbi:aromatic ring-hydroxylating oxygenase subunit alpha [Solimonas soli]|jgi:phenylpropionate dioxygenase-like ring-hydroxylating dioxygenase large terminal subunit|uniref:aromatic ring-hydroxylating oxygenase subunit alpha n=1 Tax=Solimonas soli TaxID=413479 RepID=UPI000487BDCE|nr:aromatic ring-hydroxylating dioxygenase subunit alpha [Solimonas soli]